MTDQELKDFVASLATSHAETERVLRESIRDYDFRHTETDRALRESSEKTDRALRELAQQIGGLGNKFGGFTEGLAGPSVVRMLTELGAETVDQGVRRRRGQRNIELDGLGHTNTEHNVAWIAEVKSRLTDRDLESFLRKMELFPELFPEHRDKRLYGVLVAVDVSEELAQRVLDAGIYLARADNEVFELTVPVGFEPRAFYEPPSS